MTITEAKTKIKDGVKEGRVISAEQANKILTKLGYEEQYTPAVIGDNGEVVSGDASVSLRELFDFIQLQKL